MYFRKLKEELKMEQSLCQSMLSIVLGAGNITADLFRRHTQTEQKKGPLDLVTDGDKKANRYFIEQILKKFPEHGVISEEEADFNTDAEFVWVIDPIDGTLNYQRGIPSYAVITAIRKNGEPILGCVHNPLTADTYVAKKNKGAYHNGVPIKCSNKKDLVDSIGYTNDSLSKFRLDFLNKLYAQVPDKRVWASANGCTALSCAQVAEGSKDWYVCSGGGSVWDYEGTVLLLREAGCLVTNTQGKEWKFGDGPFIAANPTLHRQLMTLF